MSDMGGVDIDEVRRDVPQALTSEEVRAKRTPAEYVERARRQMIDAGEDPDQPVYAAEDDQP